jgi:hypothetical protein
MPKTTKSSPDDIHKKGVQAYWVIRKVIQLTDRLGRKSIEGAEAFAVARSLTEIEKAVADGRLADYEREVRGWIQKTRAELKSSQEEFKSRFGTELEGRLKEAGLPLEGQFPLLHASFFRIRFDPEAGSVRISYGPDEEPLARVDPDADHVAGALQDAIKDLESMRLPDASFVGKVSAAYDRCLRMSGKKRGDKAPLLDVLKEFVWAIQSRRFNADPRRENFREYSRVHFSYHLFKLQDRGGLELGVAAREQASKKEEHLWVPTDDRGNGTHFATAAFK